MHIRTSSENCIPPAALPRGGGGGAVQNGLSEIPLPIRDHRHPIHITEGEIRRVLSAIRPYPERETPSLKTGNGQSIDMKA